MSWLYSRALVEGSTNTPILDPAQGEKSPSEFAGRCAPSLLASKPAQCGNVSASPKWWNIEPELGRVANGVPHWMDRVERLGNAQVPAVARLAFGILTARLTNDATDQQVGG